ncbi:Abi family protein [Limosilactobacillus equigenerosi]|nr:Abi family protein [Limosilactobacillus equigenerosi]
MNKPFLPVEKQIEQLKVERGLLFQNEESAKELLLRYGYYEIINGYKEHFMNSSKDDNEGFKEGTTFEHIYSLFTFDRNLRTQVMSSLETFELSLRQAVAYTVSENISYMQDEYMNRNNYTSGKKQYIKSAKRKMYPIDHLMNILKGISKSDAEPFKHYREENGNVPPWIIVKKLNFGNLIWWYKLLKGPEKRSVNARLFGINPNLVELNENLSSVISPLLELYLDYRNTAAHGGRIYNHRTKEHELPYNQLLHKRLLEIDEKEYRLGKGRSRLGVVLRSLQLFKNTDPSIELKAAISVHLNNYLKLYPDDKEYILSHLELTDDDIKI